MIFVSGTKRSGTSMWMQIFRAAGFPVLGDAFPRNWGKGGMREVNPDGFYETALRQGVYYRTNPHPKTGKYFSSEEVVPKVLDWIGSGEVEAAIAAVKPENRTQVDVAESEAVSPALARVFDDLYDALREGKGITGALLKTLNQTNQDMIPTLMKLQQEVMASQMRASAEAKKSGRKQAKPLPVTGLPGS